MMGSGRRYRRRPDFAVSGEHLFDGPEGTASELAGHGVGAVQIRIRNPHQAYRLTLLLQFFVNASVISSENARPYYGDRDLRVGLQAGFSSGWLPATNCNRKAGKEHLERIGSCEFTAAQLKTIQEVMPPRVFFRFLSFLFEAAHSMEPHRRLRNDH
jgi:hypothetical protein